MSIYFCERYYTLSNWNDIMGLREQLPFTTTKIEAIGFDGKLYTATGFSFIFDSKVENSFIPLLVTNRHVVKDVAEITIRITKTDGTGPLIGQYVSITIPVLSTNVILHPDDSVDLAAIILTKYIENYITSLFIPFFTRQDIATVVELNHINILHDIIMIGYPDGLMDEINNMPLCRKGITVTNPSIDYNGKRQFVIDASCFPGSSGSPVMSYEDGITKGIDGSIRIGPVNNQIKLIGIQSATFIHNSKGELVPMEIPTRIIPSVVTQIPNNLGIVVKASCILDFEALISCS